MKPEERDAANLWDMLSAAREAREMIGGLTREAYLGDRIRRRALERVLELLGEAARRMSEPFQVAHSEIPWRAVVGQRNVIAHEYGRIDHDRLYTTGTESIPPLIVALDRILNGPQEESGPDGRSPEPTTLA